MGTVTGRQQRNLLAALAVVAVLIGLGFGLPALDDALPAARPVRTDRPYLIGAGVTVVPPHGAVLDVTGTRPGDDQGTALFRLGPVRYSIVVRPFDGTLEAAAASLRRRIMNSSGYRRLQRAQARLAVELSRATRGVPGDSVQRPGDSVQRRCAEVREQRRILAALGREEAAAAPRTWRQTASTVATTVLAIAVVWAAVSSLGGA